MNSQLAVTLQKRTYFQQFEWHEQRKCWNKAFNSQREQSEARQNVSIVTQEVRSRLGLALTSSSSWGSHYMGGWVPSSGLASTQDTVSLRTGQHGLKHTQWKDMAHKTVAAQGAARSHETVLVRRMQSVNCKPVSRDCISTAPGMSFTLRFI